jgi:hypothetical protein
MMRHARSQPTLSHLADTVVVVGGYEIFGREAELPKMLYVECPSSGLVGAR